VDDDAFVALAHTSGTRSHLWMSVVAAQPGPRLRVLGDRAAYVKSGLDVQEDALRAGGRPGRDGWGEETPDRWGLVGSGAALRAVRTERGRYEDFYAAVATALRDGSPVPVDPADSVAVLELLEAARLSAASGETVHVG
jgi:predicted dehydrogenase